VDARDDDDVRVVIKIVIVSVDIMFTVSCVKLLVEHFASHCCC